MNTKDIVLDLVQYQLLSRYGHVQCEWPHINKEGMMRNLPGARMGRQRTLEEKY